MMHQTRWWLSLGQGLFQSCNRQSNQLWVADITYIRLKKEFVYLAVVLDAFSRKVVGWALDRTLASLIPVSFMRLARFR